MLFRNFLRRLPALATCLALAGCCANDSCDCQDELADALYFSFQLGGANGFQASDVDTFSIIRTTRLAQNATVSATSESKLFTLPLTSNGLSLKRDTIIINNASPFASSGIKLGAYDYRIIAYRTDQVAGQKVKTRYVFKINNIQLAGRFNADGCCTCYENTKKQFSYTSVATDTVTTTNQNATAPLDQPVIITLKKN